MQSFYRINDFNKLRGCLMKEILVLIEVILCIYIIYKKVLAD